MAAAAVKESEAIEDAKRRLSASFAQRSLDPRATAIEDEEVLSAKEAGTIDEARRLLSASFERRSKDPRATEIEDEEVAAAREEAAQAVLEELAELEQLEGRCVLLYTSIGGSSPVAELESRRASALLTTMRINFVALDGAMPEHKQARAALVCHIWLPSLLLSRRPSQSAPAGPCL